MSSNHANEKNQTDMNERNVCLFLFILTCAAILIFLYFLLSFSYLFLWIVIPTIVTLGFSIAFFLIVFGLLLMKARRKKRRRLAAISLGGITGPLLVLVFILALLLISTFAKGEQLPNQSRHLISPGGQYILTVPIKRIRQKPLSFGLPFLQVTISDSNGNVIYRDSEQTFPGWFGTSWIWDEHNRAWLYGSDAGTYYYENIDGDWKKEKWKKESSIKPPQLLYPKY